MGLKLSKFCGQNERKKRKNAEDSSVGTEDVSRNNKFGDFEPSKDDSQGKNKEFEEIAEESEHEDDKKDDEREDDNKDDKHENDKKDDEREDDNKDDEHENDKKDDEREDDNKDDEHENDKKDDEREDDNKDDKHENDKKDDEHKDDKKDDKPEDEPGISSLSLSASLKNGNDEKENESEEEEIKIKEKLERMKNAVTEIEEEIFGISKNEDEKKASKESIENAVLENEMSIQDPAIEQVIVVSLEDLLKGFTEEKILSRLIYDENGNFKKEIQKYQIFVKPGCKSGTKTIFPREGDQHPSRIPADLIFTIEVEDHKLFERKGCDIYHTVRLRSEDRKNNLQIPTLDDGTIRIGDFSSIFNHSIRVFNGLGLPFPEEPNKRGNLIVKFEIEDPAIKKEKFSMIRDQPREEGIEVSLESILKGTIKKVKIPIKIYGLEGIEKEEMKEFSIDIVPGCQTGTRFVYPCAGDQYSSRIPQDIVFIIEEKPHPLFTRKGNDLYYVAKIRADKIDKTFHVPTLEGDSVLIEDSDLNKTNFTKTIEGRGFPYSNEPNKRGDLVVKFEIIDSADDKDEKPECQEHILEITLEEVFKGTNIVKNLLRIVYDDENNKIEETASFKIDIPPGVTEGTRFIFYGKGNRYPLKKPEDVIFKIVDKNHPLFIRDESDIYYIAKMKQSDCGKEFQVPTIDGDKVSAKFPSKCFPELRIKIPNRGLQNAYDPNKRGDFYVQFQSERDDTSKQFSKISN